MPNIEITNEDNMQLMARYPDKYFDLAIVDPPYGLGKRTTNGGGKRNSNARFNNHEWDNETPKIKYFNELFRISKNQIIWGGNYFNLPPNRGFIIWDKMVFIPTMSRIEQAWNSIDCLPSLIQINNNDKNRIHPTQKPVALYKWLLEKYAKKGYKILDTHLGSGSIAIACDDFGFDLTACELDKDYYEKALDRLKKHQMQQKLF